MPDEANTALTAKPKRRGRPRGAIALPDAHRIDIVRDALVSLDKGETTDQIARRNKVEPRTLRAWLLVDCPAEYEHQRARYIASQLQNAIEDIESADEQIPLARARERFRSWAWLAERRLPSLFAQKQEVANSAPIQINIGITRSGEIDVTP
jgi:hypothetical protein